jgi:hypothetical protein
MDQVRHTETNNPKTDTSDGKLPQIQSQTTIHPKYGKGVTFRSIDMKSVFNDDSSQLSHDRSVEVSLDESINKPENKSPVKRIHKPKNKIKNKIIIDANANVDAEVDNKVNTDERTRTKKQKKHPTNVTTDLADTTVDYDDVDYDDVDYDDKDIELDSTLDNKYDGSNSDDSHDDDAMRVVSSILDRSNEAKPKIRYNSSKHPKQTIEINHRNKPSK